MQCKEQNTESGIINTGVQNMLTYMHWLKLKPGFNLPARRSTMPQMNMIHHPVTIYWEWKCMPVW